MEYDERVRYWSYTKGMMFYEKWIGGKKSGDCRGTGQGHGSKRQIGGSDIRVNE